MINLVSDLGEETEFFRTYEELKKQFRGSISFLNHFLSTIIGHEQAKRLNLQHKPTNCLVIGRSGSGKTFMIENILKKLNRAFFLTDTKQFSEVGYQGRDVRDVFQDFLVKVDYNKELVENGIIIFDEFDKIRAKESNQRDISGLSIQHALLKLIDGIEITIPNAEQRRSLGGSQISINTKNMIFIFIGAFSYLENDYSDIHRKLVTTGFSLEFINRINYVLETPLYNDEILLDFLDIENRYSPLNKQIQIFSNLGCKLSFLNKEKTYSMILKKGLKIDCSYRGLEFLINDMFSRYLCEVLLNKNGEAVIDGIDIIFKQ